MSCLMCIIRQKFSRAKFSRLEIDPQKPRKFSAAKISYLWLRDVSVCEVRLCVGEERAVRCGLIWRG